MVTKMESQSLQKKMSALEFIFGFSEICSVNVKRPELQEVPANVYKITDR